MPTLDSIIGKQRRGESGYAMWRKCIPGGKGKVTGKLWSEPSSWINGNEVDEIKPLSHEVYVVTTLSMITHFYYKNLVRGNNFCFQLFQLVCLSKKLC
jgi:hypothetical protein